MSIWTWLFGRRATHDAETTAAADDFRPLNWAAIPPADRQVGPPSLENVPWFSVPCEWGADRRPAGFVGLAEAMDLSAAGTSHRISNGIAFIDRSLALLKTHGRMSTVHLLREPENLHDPHAIRLMGTCQDGLVLHLGYVPSEVATMIGTQWRSDLPIYAEMREFGKKTDNSAVFFRFNILAPEAKARRKYLQRDG